MNRTRTSSIVMAILAASAALLGCGGGPEFEPPASQGSTGTAGGETGTGGEQAGPSGAGAGGEAGAGGATDCTPGMSSDCYEGPDGTKGVGACVGGIQTCDQNGELGACMGQVIPIEEDCSNTIDDNCDGQVNEGCPCAPGSTAACYSGPAGTAGVGICLSGTQICNPDGLGYGPCTGEVLPGTETCGNAVDEDCSGVACSQVLWSKLAGDGSQQSVRAVAMDGANNTYAVGAFAGTIDLGTGNLISSGGNDAFLAKYDASGAALWTKAFSAVDEQLGTDVAVDPSGNVIVAGYFKGTVAFGATTLTNTTGYSAFVAKFDPSGNPLWAASHTIGTSAYDSHVATDKDGNVILSSSYLHISFNGSYGYEVYVGKYDPSGALLWGKAYGNGPDGTDQFGGDVATDPAGNILLTGNYKGALSFGTNLGTMSSAGGQDVYVAKLDASGNGAWQKHFGDSAEQYAYGIAVDAAGNPFVAGSFYGTMMFGNPNLSAVGASDIYVAKLSSAGSTVWAKQFGDASQQLAMAIALDGESNVLLTGLVTGTTDFGGGGQNAQGVFGDVFVAKLDPNGAHTWSKIFGDADGQGGYGIATGSSKEIVIGGLVVGTVDFGDGPHTSAGASDAFIAKFAP